MKLKERFKLAWLHIKYRKHPEYKSFREILKRPFTQIQQDLLHNAEYLQVDLQDDMIRKAMVLREAMDTGCSVDLLLNPKLDAGQTDAILQGLQQGIPEPLMKRIADPNLYPEQMMEGIKAHQNNVDEGKIHSFMKPDFTAEQMHEIRLAHESRMPASHIRIFAEPSVHPAVMKELKGALRQAENPNINDTLALKQKLQVAAVSIMRIGLENQMDQRMNNRVLEQMALMHPYWNLHTCKEFTKEICEEVQRNAITYDQLDDYFKEKFQPAEPAPPVAEKAPQVSTAGSPDSPLPAAEQAPSAEKAQQVSMAGSPAQPAESVAEKKPESPEPAAPAREKSPSGAVQLEKAAKAPKLPEVQPMPLAAAQPAAPLSVEKPETTEPRTVSGAGADDQVKVRLINEDIKPEDLKPILDEYRRQKNFYDNMPKPVPAQPQKSPQKQPEPEFDAGF